MFINKVIDVLLYGFVRILSNEWKEPAKIAIMVGSILFIAIAAYLLGSLNFAIIISKKQYNQDIRNFGSNNAGMTNMMRTYGRKAAALTFIGDILKAVVSCIIGYLLLGQFGAYTAGLFCIIGHVFPLYYKFKGGKGVVTAGVTIVMCNPIVGILLMIMFALIVLTTKYISLASVMCMLFYPPLLNQVDPLIRDILGMEPSQGSIGGVFAVLMTCLIVVKHWSNIKRLLNGTESKFSFKKSVKKSDLQKEETVITEKSDEKNSK